MKPVHGEAPVIGYEVPIDKLRIDYETYKFMYQAASAGVAMTPQQMERYTELREIFEK